MQSSFIKQLIYGIFYLAIIFFVGYLFYLAILPEPTCFDGRKNQGEKQVDCGGPCESCEIRVLEPIEVVKTSVLKASDKQSSVLTEFRNPNIAFGANSFSYRLDFYGAGDVLIESFKKGSFIYPGRIKFIADAGINIAKENIRRVEVTIGNVSWKSISEFSAPNTQVRDIEINKQNDTRLIVSGVVNNNTSFRLSRVVITVLVSDLFNLPVSVSKTLLENVGAFKEENFSVIIPNETMADVARDSVRVFVEAER